jgi:putative ABC transport system permease protein
MLASMERAEGAADNRVVVRSKISLTFDLPESYWARLETIPHLKGVTPLTWYQGVFIDDRPENFFARFAADPETFFDVFPEVTITEAEKATWRAERDAFIAGKVLADKYGWQLDDRIHIKGDIYPVDVDLVLRGIFTVPEAPAQERQIYFHRKYLEEAMDNPGSVGTYWLLVESPAHVPEVISAAEAMFLNAERQVRAETEQAFQLSFLEMMGNVRVLFGAIGLAVIVSIFFISANTMAMTARERTPEVAVLKSIGFPRRSVVGMVLGESVLVGFLGAMIGCALAFGIVKMLGRAMSDTFPVFGSLWITPAVMASSIGLGLLIGVLAGAFPALGAARLKVIDGLRRLA